MVVIEELEIQIESNIIITSLHMLCMLSHMQECWPGSDVTARDLLPTCGHVCHSSARAGAASLLYTSYSWPKDNGDVNCSALVVTAFLLKPRPGLYM